LARVLELLDKEGASGRARRRTDWPTARALVVVRSVVCIFVGEAG
jgi:hypothetical protein